MINYKCFLIDQDKTSYIYRVELTNSNTGEIFVIPRYHMGIALQRDPELLDILASILTDTQAAACESFDEFAAEYGYDPDRRKAAKI